MTLGALVRLVRRRWRELLIEAAGSGIVLAAACTFGTLLEYPGSPLHQAIPMSWLRRAIMGSCMGLTVAALIYSPWGRRSGAHFNVATTLTFLRLGRVAPADAAGYVAAQFVGAALGIAAAGLALGGALADPAVHHVTTVPGPAGAPAAFVAELAISGALMLAALEANASTRLMRWTGLVAASLVATFIAVESPLSGASMNPSRSFGSALAAHDWMPLWVYLAAPPLGMFVAAEVHRRLSARRRPAARAAVCAKLMHDDRYPCHFCQYREYRESRERNAERVGNRGRRAAITAAASIHQTATTPRRSAMSRKSIVIAAAVIVVAGAWYAFRPERLFVSKEVNEKLDAGTVTTADSAAPMLAMGDAKVARALASGTFHSNAHETRGKATVYQLPGGGRILRLTEFETSNGPDVHIYLVAAADVQDNATVKTAGFVDLGSMKGNKGDQNYEIPASIDLAKYRAATVWCRRFSVNFGAAPLT